MNFVRLPFQATVLCLFIATSLIAKPRLHVVEYGTKGNPAMIYLHGGPGYNSSGFEATTARPLAELGYHVISYDRRGEGRSIDHDAVYSFEETFEDLVHLMKQLKIKQASLIGHSFGGMVGTLFATRFPEKVRGLYLVGSPISLQESFRTILSTCREIYSAKSDTLSLRFIHQIQSMDTSLLQYSTFCFSHAMQNGFYVPKNRSQKALDLMESWRNDPDLGKAANMMGTKPPQGFWKNDRYTTIDLRPYLQNLVRTGIAVRALYGKEDGLYSFEQILELEGILGAKNLRYLDNCSHNVFIDQQEEFLARVAGWELDMTKAE